MIAGLDSSFSAPSAAQAEAAKAGGIRVWCGYIATRGGVGLAAPWTELAFYNARRCGGMPIAFCSGQDDPTAVKNLAAAWKVRPCLDVESGIRSDGGWVQGWLDASGAGLYGGASVHNGRRAAFHILASYPGNDPGAIWPAGAARPSGPLGWQWRGTHNEFGCTVDRLWLDDWFGSTGGDQPMTADERRDVARALTRIVYEVCRRGEPESEQALQDHAGPMAAGKFEDGVVAMFDAAPEFQAELALDRQIRADYQAGAFAHPGPIGPEGPAGPVVTDDHIATVATAAMIAEIKRLVNG